MKETINLINSYPNYFFLIGSFCSVYLLTFIFKNIFLNIGFVDKPNARSNHESPVPLGGGVSIIFTTLIITNIMLPQWSAINTIIVVLLFSISILDDFFNINILGRLCIHLICAFLYINIYLKSYFLEYFDVRFVEFKILLFLLGIFSIAWFINAFNFMDGIDGITSVYSISMLISLIFLYKIMGQDSNSFHFLLLGSMIGFLYFNWHPAKIFLGDAGSIPLGFLMAHLLIEFAFKGFWVAALILPLYYLMDTSITILYRLSTKKILWKSHNDHFYQLGIRNGRNHKSVCYLIIISSFGLFLLSYFAVIFKNNILFLLIGMIWCLFFLINFKKRKINKKYYE